MRKLIVFASALALSGSMAFETVNELNDQLSGFSFPITKYRFN